MKFKYGQIDIPFLFFCSVLLLLQLYVLHLPFFWDGLSVSTQAQWFYNHDFSSFTAPTIINPGHPPLLFWVLAVLWKIFGLHLWVGHLLCVPIVLCLAWQIRELFNRFLDRKILLWVYLLVLVEPTFIAQTVLVHQDVFLLFFFVLGVNQILDNKKRWLFLSVICMSLLNLRGVFLGGVLAMLDLVIHFKTYKAKYLLQFVGFYVMSLLPFALYELYQFRELGWIIISPSDSWAEHREVGGLYLVLRNITVVIRNLLDHGRVGVWFLSVLLLFVYFKKWYSNSHNRIIGILLFVHLLVLSIFFLPFSNPIGHRYYLFTYLLLILIFFTLWKNISNNFYKHLLFVLAFLSLLSGHFIVLPNGVSQGWDSSLAYLNYFSLREDLIDYMKVKEISFEDTQGKFPLTNSQITDLHCEFMFADVKDENAHYFVISKFDNSLDVEKIKEIKTCNTFVKGFWKKGLWLELYKKGRE